MEELLEIEVRVVGETTRVKVSGEIDVGSAPELDAALARVDGGAVVLDLTGVEFMDSTGLNVLVQAARSGKPIVIERCSPNVQRLLRLTGVEELFRSAP